MNTTPNVTDALLAHIAQIEAQLAQSQQNWRPVADGTTLRCVLWPNKVQLIVDGNTLRIHQRSEDMSISLPHRFRLCELVADAQGAEGGAG